VESSYIIGLLWLLRIDNVVATKETCRMLVAFD
jgi:hypothetical protein